MSNRHFLGIEVSTTGSKALLLDEGGKVVAVTSSPHTLQTPRPLWSEQNPGYTLLVLIP
jgi:xylulokinase